MNKKIIQHLWLVTRLFISFAKRSLKSQKSYSSIMKNILLVIFLILFFAACSASPSPAVLSTETSTPSPAIATSTVVWFPPTPTHTPFPTQVITPTADMRPQLGEIIFEDDFSDPQKWSLSQTDLGSAAMAMNELTIAIGETNMTLSSIREQPVLSDFYLEVTASPSICRNLDEYGVLLRVTSADDFYRFSLSCNGQVRLDRLIGGQASSPQPWLLSGAVPPGAPSSSLLGISAVGPNMDFFVNGQFQFSVKDPLLSSGGIGLFARSANKMAVTVNFSDLVVYNIAP
jgi:hypothetical protein